MKAAICPGSFDPVTLGHLDIITRARKLFDQVYVAVLENSAKRPLFTVEERMRLLRTCLGDREGIEIVTFSGLLADSARQYGAAAIVKGLRAVTDFEYEFQMALTNKKLNPELETLYLNTSAEYMYLSSSIVKEVGKNGGDISAFVHPAVAEEIRIRLNQKGDKK